MADPSAAPNTPRAGNPHTPSTSTQATTTLTIFTTAITISGVRVSPAPRKQELPMNITDESAYTEQTTRR